MGFEERLWVAFVVVSVVVLLAYWWFYRDAATIERLKLMGSYGEVDLEAAIDEAGRKRVCFCWVWTDEMGNTVDQRLLMTPRQARELAQMLRLAAARGRTLAVARWHLRHDGNPPAKETARSP